MRWRCGWAFAIVAACGGDHHVDNNGNPDAAPDTPGVAKATGSAKFVHGPKGPTSAIPRLGGPLPAAADGRWSITPDQAKLTFTSITFVRSDGQPVGIDLTGCQPTYDRSAASLSQLLDCSFEVPEGTYGSVGLGASTTFQFLIDDAVNGIYTDGTGIVTTSPGTAQLTTFTVPGPGGMGDMLSSAIYLAEPLVVTADTPVSISVMVDMIHMVGVDISGGVATFDDSLPVLPATVVPSPLGAGKTQFFSYQSSTDNLMYGPPGTTQTWAGVRVFYAEPSQPSYIFHPVPGPSQAYNVNPAKAPANGTQYKAGGYLGIDGSNVMCWAMPANDYSYTTYDRVCRMQMVTAGNSTTIECQTGSTAPAPVSGDTYASGCPAITPNVTMNVTLVAE